MQIESNIQISIVVPAYNSANYLERCISSMACQDLPYSCYEVIVINDGSTDNSAEVLNTLCSQYSFLRFVTTANGGLSRARNKGIEIALGKYLLFVDSDDSISPYVLGRIYKEMESGDLDMMLLNYVHVSTTGESLEIPFRMDGNPRGIVTGRNFLFADAFPPMVWSYVYKHSFLICNSLAMIPIWHEDEEFTPRAIYFANRIKYFPLLFCNYFQNKDSFMESSKEASSKYIILAMSSLVRFAKEYSIDSESRKYFENRIARTLMQLFKNSIRRGHQNQNEMIEELIRSKVLPLKPKRMTFYYYLFNISPLWFEKYYRFIKHKYKKG